MSLSGIRSARLGPEPRRGSPEALAYSVRSRLTGFAVRTGALTGFVPRYSRARSITSRNVSARAVIAPKSPASTSSRSTSAEPAPTQTAPASM